MRKRYVEPEIVKIELNMTENIATSIEEETNPVEGFNMRQAKGTNCRVYYVKTTHKVINEFTLLDIYFAGCIFSGSNEEQTALMLLR